jgi:aryl-alcohol dehydrogenase-like predicted oxidoreductase
VEGGGGESQLTGKCIQGESLREERLRQLTLGATGITTSALALGCDRLGSILTPLTRKQSLSLISEALDLGIRHFDTANIYGQGDSERYLGVALQHVRERVCLATKAGQRLTAGQSVVARVKGPLRIALRVLGKPGGGARRRKALASGSDFSPSQIEASLLSSLRRLRTDRVDILYLHSPPLDVLHDDDLFYRLARQRELGRIGAVGVSCDDLDVALAAAKHKGTDIVQFELTDDDMCREILRVLADRKGVSIVRGVARKAAQPGTDFAATIDRGVTSALALPTVCGVIIGTINAHHLRTNVAALRGIRQSAEESS